MYYLTDNFLPNYDKGILKFITSTRKIHRVVPHRANGSLIKEFNMYVSYVFNSEYQDNWRELHAISL